MAGNEHEIKLTDTTTGVHWDCSSCPAWGLSPNKDAAEVLAAKHSYPDHEITFGTIQPDGQVTNVRLIKQSDIGACPHSIFEASHYRTDGTCKCDDVDEQAMMIREWEYEPGDFKGPTKEEAKS